MPEAPPATAPDVRAEAGGQTEWAAAGKPRVDPAAWGAQAGAGPVAAGERLSVRGRRAGGSGASSSSSSSREITSEITSETTADG